MTKYKKLWLNFVFYLHPSFIVTEIEITDETLLQTTILFQNEQTGRLY